MAIPPPPPAFACSAAESEGCHAGVDHEVIAKADVLLIISFKASAVAKGYGETRRLGMPSDNFHYVYILVSEANAEKHYAGCTSNLSARLKKHNEDGCLHTSKYRPWKIETAIAFKDKSKAIAFESYLKSGSGREFSRRHF